MVTVNLKNLNILVTRPRELGAGLVEEITRAHGQALHLPTIEITPLCISNFNLGEFDFLIFTSQAAVHYSAQLLTNLPSHIKIAAIGKSTAEKLFSKNLSAVYPADAWNSEALLKLPLLNENIACKKVAIITGANGRNILAEILKQRAAHITTIAVYKRIRPKIRIKQYLAKIRRINIIIGTSEETISNLLYFLKNTNINLYIIPLVVASHRIQEFAYKLGFKKIIVARNSSNAMLIEACKELL